jgi:phosphatidylinositol alpha-mannosyltransferase
VSRDAYELARQYVDGEYVLLFNGVELERFRTATPAAHPAGHTIFFCGRHEERKGLDVLLRALGELPTDVTCWVASDGPDTSRLRSEFAGDPRVVWLGRLSDEAKMAHLAAADVFCAPSLHGESFGVVLLEAMAAGTPVVATALDGYRNVATDGVDALLVPPGDHHALAAALRRVLTDPGLSARLAAAGATRADAFSMVELARRYVELYRSVVGLREPDGGYGAWPDVRRSVTARMMQVVRRLAR